jgi:hypothetical protein
VKPATVITITAKNCNREYGENNPTFEYEVSGGTPTGTPTLICAATKTSDVGTYEIIVGKGTLQGNVELVNGTMTVTKAPLTASVGDYTREEGQGNPTFVISYSGWKNTDNESVLTKKPVATTTATTSSAPGTYPITVSGGEAKNYEFTYKSGTLTVTKKQVTTGTATLAIEPFTITKGGEAEMLIDVENPNNEVTLVQFDLRLPDGLTLKQANGEYDIDIAGRTTWRKHSLDASLQSDSSIRFLLASSSNAALSGTSGAVIKMILQASSTFSGGIARLENALLVSPDETESKPDTYQYEVKTDETSPLSIEPFSIGCGETKEMLVDLTNPDDEITLVQFDLRLPTGLSIAMEYGEFAIDIAGRTTWKKHSLDANDIDGIVRFLLSSTKNAVLEGTNGAIISIKLTAASNFTGNEIRLENILLVTPDEKEIKPDDYVVYVPLGINDIMMDAPQNVSIYSLSGLRLTAPRKGVNIVGGKKVVVK